MLFKTVAFSTSPNGLAPMFRILTISLCTLPAFAAADAPTIDDVVAKRSGDSWRFSVTLSHPDTGWDDYANAWEVRLADGTILGTRILAHPHVNEQPFTRSLSGVTIPDGVTEVWVYASDLLTGYGDEGKLVELP